MIVLRLVPILVSALLLGAHFFRSGSILLVILALLIPVVLLIKRPWAARLVQLSMIIGAAEWVRTLLVLVADRQADGETWTRLAVILGLVAAFTAASALPFSISPKVRRRFGLGD